MNSSGSSNVASVGYFTGNDIPISSPFYKDPQIPLNPNGMWYFCIHHPEYVCSLGFSFCMLQNPLKVLLPGMCVILYSCCIQCMVFLHKFLIYPQLTKRCSLLSSCSMHNVHCVLTVIPHCWSSSVVRSLPCNSIHMVNCALGLAMFWNIKHFQFTRGLSHSNCRYMCLIKLAP